MAYTQDQNPGGLDTLDNTTLANGDLAVVGDVSDSNRAKGITWTNIKAFLKTYFDTLYPSGSGTSTGTNTGDQTNISGNAATVTTNANLTGDVTSVGNATTIGAGKVTEAMQVLADNTTQDVTSTKHGYVPKSPADATKFLNGAATPGFAQVKDSDLSTTDITTNDVSSSKHGFAPKGDGTTTKFLNANGAYSTPAGGGGAQFTVSMAGTQRPSFGVGTTNYVDSDGSAGSDTTRGNVTPVAGTLKNLVVYMTANTLTTASTTFTLNVNNSLTGITVTVAAGVTTTTLDTTHTSSISAGDRINLKTVVAAGGAGSIDFMFSYQVT